jgi:hypothetical protein
MPESQKIFNPISQPTLTKTVSGYSLEFADEKIIVNLDRVTDDGVGELSVIHNNGNGAIILQPRTQVNLLAERTLSGLAKKLEKRLEIDWQTVIDYSSHYAIEEARKGSPIENIDTPPDNPRLEYLLYPILLKNQPTTIFSPGGSGKSLIADLIALSIQYKLTVLDWVPIKGNVMYLDWEADSQVHKRYIQAIKKGLHIENKTQKILYTRCESDLVKIIDAIYKQVIENNISLVIIDSQMAATASGRPGADAAQVSSMYYNALRQLPCASLTIDHVSKASMENTNAGNPYGSIVKTNRARSTFEMKQYQEVGEDTLEIALFHQKFNLGKKLKPIGIRIDFFNKEKDILDEVRFESFNIEENEELSKSLKPKDQIKAYLIREGSATKKTISDELNLTYSSVSKMLDRNTDIFIKFDDDEWGVK